MSANRRVRVTIPDDLSFGDLRLTRAADGGILFDHAVIDRVCAVSGIDAALIWQQPEDNAAALIVAWYAEHLRQGGEPDPVAEQIGAEVRAEDGYEGKQ